MLGAEILPYQPRLLEYLSEPVRVSVRILPNVRTSSLRNALSFCVV